MVSFILLHSWLHRVYLQAGKINVVKGLVIVHCGRYHDNKVKYNNLSCNAITWDVEWDS